MGAKQSYEKWVKSRLDVHPDLVEKDPRFVDLFACLQQCNDPDNCDCCITGHTHWSKQGTTKEVLEHRARMEDNAEKLPCRLKKAWELQVVTNTLFSCTVQKVRAGTCFDRWLSVQFPTRFQLALADNCFCVVTFDVRDRISGVPDIPITCGLNCVPVSEILVGVHSWWRCGCS